MSIKFQITNAKCQINSKTKIPNNFLTNEEICEKEKFSFWDLNIVCDLVLGTWYFASDS